MVFWSSREIDDVLVALFRGELPAREARFALVIEVLRLRRVAGRSTSREFLVPPADVTTRSPSRSASAGNGKVMSIERAGLAATLQARDI